MLPAPGTSEALTGEIARVVFSSEESGFTVVRIAVPGRRDPVTAVGRMPGLREGETVKVAGRWKHDSRFGEQLEVERYEAVLPVSEEGIRRYLGSGMVHGIGPKLAERIVSRFGAATLEVIEREPDRLAEVKGVGAERVGRLKAAWDKEREVRAVTVFLEGFGIAPAWAHRIVRRFGQGAARVVQENPYRLADEVRGIGFKTADAIARRAGIAEDSPARLDAAVKWVLSEAASEGHCYLPAEELFQRVEVAVPQVARVRVEAALERLESAGATVREGASLFPRDLFEAEKGSAQRLAILLAASPQLTRPLEPEKALSWVEARLSRTLAPGQRDALVASAGGKVSVITGGPGTGKTTVIDAICRVVAARGESIALAAPTGRAAKRLSEATGREAKTLHRLLEWDPRGGGFLRRAGKPLGAQVVIVDECSMVDLPLFAALLAALPDATRLVLVGDADQLPSVGPGNVLRDLIASGKVPVTRLSRIFRQASGSAIVENAHRVNRGEPPVFESEEFAFVAAETPEEAVARVGEWAVERLPRRFRLDPLRDVQVLCPMNRGTAGTIALNAALQEKMNPRGEEVPGARRFRVGDRVLQVRNDYDKDVFNGDLGRICEFDEEEGVLTVEFEGRPVLYPPDERDDLVLAYACSIHRSQGSEYPAVVIPLLTQHYVMLQRNLLYTAITRGKRAVALVGSRKAIGMAVRNAEGGRRWTGLRERL